MKPIAFGRFEDVFPAQNGAWLINNETGVFASFRDNAPYVTRINGYPIGVIDDVLVCFWRETDSVCLFIPNVGMQEIGVDLKESFPYAISRHKYTALEYSVIHVKNEDWYLYLSRTVQEGVIGKYQAVIVDHEDRYIRVVRKGGEKFYWAAAELGYGAVVGVGKDLFVIAGREGGCVLCDGDEVVDIPPHPRSIVWKGMPICSPVSVEPDTNNLICLTETSAIACLNETGGWEEIVPSVSFLPRRLMVAGGNLVVVGNDCVCAVPLSRCSKDRE